MAKTLSTVRFPRIGVRNYTSDIEKYSTYPHGKVHVVEFVAGKPDETVRMARPENQLEILAVASSVVRRGQQFKVVHHPRVAVEVPPEVITGRQRWLRCWPWCRCRNTVDDDVNWKW